MLIEKSTYSLADGHSFFRQGLGVGHVVLHDGLEELILVLSIKRRLKKTHTHTQHRRVYRNADKISVFDLRVCYMNSDRILM